MQVCLLLVFAVSSSSMALYTIPVRDLRIDGIYATRAGDRTLFCLLGGNACIGRFPDNAWNKDSLIDRWLTAHPDATALSISSRRWRLGKASPPEPRVYLWIEDHGDSLNVTLVREGHYSANAMIDMVEADLQMVASLPAAAKERIEKEWSQLPEEDKPRRLVSDADYLVKRERVFAAETDAKTHQRGIWSEAGLRGRAPPQDNYMIRQFFEKRDSFERVRVLQSTYPSLASMNRQENTAKLALSAGVSPAVIQEYRELLEKLDANEELNGVSGFDDACLIVADILYGAFDNGVIKGYVFRRDAPSPIVNDLDDAKAVPGVDTMYRRVDDNWYLFEIWH